jgi:Fusaric acid resistance protein family
LALPPQCNAAAKARLFEEALRAAGPQLLFGLRLWASVSLALYAAFWLQLDNPFWAGASAAIVCQPQLGASLRKGWFRMLGTPVGAVMSIVLTACFAQDRALYLAGLALWGAACAFVAVLLHNFASYAASLAGYTVAVIAGDLLGTVGGVDANAAFLLAVTRATEICLGIVCAGVVLAATDLGGARRRLSVLFADLASGVTAGLIRTLATAGSNIPDSQLVRREFVGRVIALDPIIDQTLGESSEVRYHSPWSQRAVGGLFSALAGWRAVADHLARLPGNEARHEAVTILENVPQELRSTPQPAVLARWIRDPAAAQRLCEAGERRLIELRADTPSLRLLADKTAEALAGIACALNGLVLLVADPPQTISRRGRNRLLVPDWLPALISAGRTFAVNVTEIVALEIHAVLICRQHRGAARHGGPANSRVIVEDRADAHHAV